MKKSILVTTISGLLILVGSATKAQDCRSMWDYVGRLALEADMQSAKASGAWKSGNRKEYCTLIAQRQTLGKYILTAINEAISCYGYATPEAINYRDKAIRNKAETDSLASQYCR